MDDKVLKLSLACVDVLATNYGISVSMKDFVEGMDRVRNLTSYFLTFVSEKHPEMGLAQSDIEVYSDAAMFHDVGKFLIDPQILNKPGRLTVEEYAVIKNHPSLGLEILEQVCACDNDLLGAAKNAAYMHHERWDGSGYPNGLKGNEIPLSVQAIALADVYDALRSDRPYKKAMPHEVAKNLIKAGKCGCFNPVLLECLDEHDCVLMSNRLAHEVLKNKAKQNPVISGNESLDFLIQSAEKKAASFCKCVPDSKRAFTR